MMSLQSSKTILFVGNHLSKSNQNLSVNEELSTQLLRFGWSSILISRKINRLLRFWDMISTIVNKKSEYLIAEVDIFSGAAFVWGFFCALVVKLIHKPLVLTLHGGNLPNFARKYVFWVKLLLRWGDVVVSPSNYLREQMAIYRRDIRLIPNGISIQNYPYRERQIITPNIIWLRAFHEIYNPSLGPKVVKKLQERGHYCHLTMVGPDKKDGSFEKALSTAKELGVDDLVHFIPGVSKEEVPSLLNKADIFLNTTNFDNTPVSVLEAMACGLCIVSTNVGGVTYMINDEEDSLLTQPDDSDAMAYAVERIITSPELANKLTKNARAKALQSDWSTILPLWDRIFWELS